MIKSKRLTKLLETRLFEKKALIQVLLGPRQVGKTTFISNFIKPHPSKYHYVSGDGIHETSWISEQWQKAQDDKKILIIDEIQKIPAWSEAIKKHWDDRLKLNQRIYCILLGSSSMHLEKGLSESLTGRFEVIPAYHWNFQKTVELKKMTLDNYLIFGGYPGSYQFIKEKNRWSDYLRSSIVDTVITKDILFQAKVKSPALFRQCFYVLANSPAQVISYNKILGQLQDKGNTDLIKYYIELFERAFMLKSIHNFSKNEIRKKLSSPKIISLAPALNTFHRLDNLSPEYMGRVFESLVGAQLSYVFQAVYYWANADFEVDYVLEFKGHIIAIEVKSGRTKKSKSVEMFLLQYPKAKVIFIDKQNYEKFEKSPLKFIEAHI
jgi:predicted AAA+ superfamily ATPase